MAPKIFLCSHRYMIYDAILSILMAAFKRHIHIGEPTYIVTSFKKIYEYNKLLQTFTNVSMIITEQGNTNCSQQILDFLESNTNINVFIYYDIHTIKPGLLHILKRCHSKNFEVYCDSKLFFYQWFWEIIK